MHLWRLEAHVVYLPLSLSSLVVETAFLTEPGAAHYLSEADWLLSLGLYLVMPL